MTRASKVAASAEEPADSGGPGGFGGGGPGRAMTIAGRRGFDINHPHGSDLLWSWRFSAQCRALFTRPASLQSSRRTCRTAFGGSVGGPLNIPKIYHGGTKTFFFVNYNGRRGSNPFDQFSTVPTLLERQGKLLTDDLHHRISNGQPVTIFDPATSIAFRKQHAHTDKSSCQRLCCSTSLSRIFRGISRIFIS